MSWLVKLDADLIRQVIIQAATFLVFFVVVKVFFADKIKEILDKRRQAIEKELDEAEASNQHAKALEEEYAVHMRGALDEKAAILKNASEDGVRTKAQIIADAHLEATVLLDNARKEISREKSQAEKELQEGIVDLAISAAETVSGQTLTDEDQRKLIEESIRMIREA